jgi:hypothetical protein
VPGVLSHPGRRLARRQAERAVAFWRGRLGIPRPVAVERVSSRQVVGPTGRRGCSLVGVVLDEASATIYHTRALTPEDVVHELLHVAHPDWSEARVCDATDALLAGPRPHRRRCRGAATRRPWSRCALRRPAG